MTKTEERKTKRRSRRWMRLRLFLFFPLVLAFMFAERASVTKDIVIVPEWTYDPMGFMLRPESPCIGTGATIEGLTTDFFGLPVDPNLPTIGSVQYHEPTPDYMALVRKIMVSRVPGLTNEQREVLEAEIDGLFLKVYGYPRSQLRGR